MNTEKNNEAEIKSIKSEVPAELELLPLSLKKNGYEYKQIKRGDHAAIYEARDPENENKIAFYETFEIRVSQPKIAFGKSYGAYEIFPGNGVFGMWAWCYGAGSDQQRALNRATEKFDLLEEKGKQKESEKPLAQAS